MVSSPGPPLPAPSSPVSQGLCQLCLQPWPVLAFQALDAIEKAQDLAEEVGNKVRPDSVFWVWSQEPKVGSRVCGEGFTEPAHALSPSGSPGAAPTHSHTLAISLPPTEHFGGQGKNSVAQRTSEFLRAS